jgi:hypothetical protein
MSDDSSVYPDAKRQNTFDVGEAFAQYVAKLLLRLRRIELHFYVTKKEQYTIGENHEGFEIKLLEKCVIGGRLFIEIAERTLNTLPWRPAGIFRLSDNTRFFVVGNYEYVVIFRIEDLRRWAFDVFAMTPEIAVRDALPPRVLQKDTTIRSLPMPLRPPPEFNADILYDCRDGMLSAPTSVPDWLVAAFPSRWDLTLPPEVFARVNGLELP